jgi:hypothetical protein
MKTSRLMTLLSAMLALAWSVMACAQPVGENPKFAVGDQWEFAWTMQPSGKAEAWSRTVVETPGKDRLRVKFETNAIQDYDGAMNFMPQGRTEFVRQFAVYPLTVGKEWPIARSFDNPGISESGKARVVAIEQLTVPAGIFQCFRVEAEATLVRKLYWERRFWTRWYCPDVKWIGKEILETTTFSPYNPAANGTTTETLELVRFTPGK